MTSPTINFHVKKINIIQDDGNLKKVNTSYIYLSMFVIVRRVILVVQLGHG
jgi:hypothetical protein